MGRRYFRRQDRPLLVVLAAVLAAAVACSAHPAGGGGHPAVPSSPATSEPPPAAGPPLASVQVTCHDRPTDAALLQQAINSSPVGAAIEFQGGTCLLTTGLTLLSNRTYTGESTTGTVLKQDGSASYVLASSAYAGNATTTGEPLAIRDLTVACNGSGATDGIVLMNWQIDVENVNVSNCGGSGIVDTNTNAAGSAITNTSVNSRFDNNYISGSGHYGFAVLDSGNSVTDGFLIDNQIALSGMDGIYLQNAEGWDISGNHLYGNRGNAVSADRLYGTTISDNYIEDFASSRSSGTWYGIRGTVQNGLGSTITGNKIFNDQGENPGPRYIYLGITAVTAGTGHLAVTGNVIMGVRHSDIGQFFTGGANNLSVVVSGNEITGVGTALANGGHVTLGGAGG